MQDHRTAAVHDDVARDPAGRAQHVQRRLLLELVTQPPVQGDTIDDLAASLGQSSEDIRTATTALAACGLAEPRGQTVHASAAARRFEELWPTI